MNHTNNLKAVSDFLVDNSSIHAITNKSLVPNAPYILGEGNSIASQGIGDVSNSFGAAL